MTRAIRASAMRERLSMLYALVVREGGRSRRPQKDYSEGFGGRRAMSRAERRASRGPRSRTRNTTGDTGMTPATAAKATPGIRGQRASSGGAAEKGEEHQMAVRASANSVARRAKETS